MNEERLVKLNEEANRLLDIINDPEQDSETKHRALTDYNDILNVIKTESSISLDFYKAESDADIKRQKNANDKEKDDAELKIREKESRGRWIQTIVGGIIAGLFTLAAPVLGTVISEIGLPSKLADTMSNRIEKSNGKFDRK